MPHNVKPVSRDAKAEAFIAGVVQPARAATAADGAGMTTVNMRWDTLLLARVDEAARKQGISRTAWLHVAAAKALE